MFLNTRMLTNQIIQEDVINYNPLHAQDLLKKSVEEEKEKFLQEQVSRLFKDRDYYRFFQEAVIPNQPAPVQPQVVPPSQASKQAQNEAKAKLIQNQLNTIEKQKATTINQTPDKQKSLEEKHLDLQAQLEKLRIDSHERIADKQLDMDRKHGTKRAVAQSIAGGVGASLLPALIGGAIATPWGKLFGKG